MSNESGNSPEKSTSHTPLLPQQEIQSDFQAWCLFIPLVIKYLARHLTVGSYIRFRRVILRRLGRTYYV
jgi:hypothetical protein